MRGLSIGIRLEQRSGCRTTRDQGKDKLDGEKPNEGEEDKTPEGIQVTSTRQMTRGDATRRSSAPLC